MSCGIIRCGRPEVMEDVNPYLDNIAKLGSILSVSVIKAHL